MSETTSTNISVAPANSTESIQAFSSRHSRMTGPGFTKRICFYKSGDPRFNGIKMVVTNRSFKTFDALLDNLSKKVPLPFGVRNITTPRGIHPITSLEELEDGKSYICSHQKKIKPINLERASKKPLLWQSSRPISARRRVMQVARQSEVAPFQRENTIVLGSSKNCVVYKNGDKEFKHDLVLNKKSIQNFDAFLYQISEALQFPVFKLYSTDGRRILSTHALLLSSGTIVAAGREPFKAVNYESETEYLPAKLPGIYQRVFPKSRTKPEMRSHVKTSEPVTTPSEQDLVHSSANVCNSDRDFADFSHIPDNEIHLTEQWPHSGEELPVISPGDNIEKSVHLNCDGTMTVEMKVRFKIREEETINWSTTVSRANLSYYKKKVICSSVNPEIQSVSIIDSPKIITNIDHKTHDETKDSIEHRYETNAERVQNQIQDYNVISDQNTTSPMKREKLSFYRPPTPGIRKSQERRLFIRRASEGKLQENMKHMFSFNDMESNPVQSVNDILDHCNKQMLTTADNVNLRSNGADPKRTETDHKNEENFFKLEEENFDIGETPRMELLHRNTVYEKGVRKSDRSDYVCFTGLSTGDRPYSAGKHMYHQDQFKFKEIKRSVSASITFSEESPLHGETTHTNNESELDLKDCLDSVSQGNAVSPMAAVPTTNSTNETHGTKDLSSATSMDNLVTGSGTDSCLSNDNHSTSSMGQKKKKKIIGDSLKEINTNVPNDGKPPLESTQIVCGISCGGMNPETKHIVFEEIFPPQKSSITNQSEAGTIRKLKGNRQMAKVKPRSVKTIDKSIYSLNQNSEKNKEKKDNAEIDIISSKEIADYSGTIVSNGSILYTDDQAECSLTEYNHVTDEPIPKNISEKSKRSQKTAKKQKVPKKKPNNKVHETKTANNTNRLESEEVSNSPTLPNDLESYIQTWLTNILPNAALPVLQLLSSTRLESDLTHSSKDSGSQPRAETTMMMTGEVCRNANGIQMHNEDEEHQVEPFHAEPMTQKEMFIQNIESFTDDAVSVVMESSKHFAELFAQQLTDFGHNTFCESNKAEELINCMASHQLINVPPKKASTDAAVQVENKTLADYIKCSCMRDVWAEQLKLSPQNIQNSKCRQLEKSLSLPNSPSKVDSSSSRLLLAWLIVLHLKQGMFQTIEGLSNSPNSSSTIFTLLQTLKQIAITEKADDLKAAVLNLQESRFHLVTNNVQSVIEPTPMQEYPRVPTNSIDSDQLHHLNVKDKVDSQCMTEPCDKPDLLKNEAQNVLAGDSDDLHFFAAELYRELSGENCHNESSEYLQQCSLLESQESFNIVATDLPMEESISTDIDHLEKCHVDLSQTYTASSMSHINFGSDHNMETCSVSPKKVSKVKMMVQEMEQRKNISHGSEHQKCLQSPMSSDWSDYRPDSEESMSDNLRSSSEIMTESGEEQVHKKLFKSGYVKRTIERLYGKAESKFKLPKTPTSVSPISVIQTQPKRSPKNKNNEHFSVHCESHQCVSKENISSPSNKKEIVKDNLSSLKRSSLPLLEDAVDHGYLISQRPMSSQNKELKKYFFNEGGHAETDTGTDGGVLIDKGRWLLKENHLVRKSPPAITGMYTNLDTTSADTLLDNTSDDVSYLHFACKINEMIAEVSSSELEDMAKPKHHTCHYFNMPHGSDSEPFNDVFSTNSKARPKSSDALIKSKTHDSVSLESIKKFGAKSASLTSFATVEFHYTGNKVHPLPQADAENTSDGQPLSSPSTSRRQVKEQDSLDKLQVICGQHCPILTAIMNPINELDRGFAYRRPYDIENLPMLYSELTKKESLQLLNKYPFVDENNNIHYNMKLPCINGSKSNNNNMSFVYDNKYILEGIEAFRNMSKGRQHLSSLYPISTIQIVNIIRLYRGNQTSNLFQGVSFMGNDENNNILYHNI